MGINQCERRALDAAECMAVLTTARIGRIALTERALPVIVPVAYEVDREALNFPAFPQAVARAADARYVVCFQTDSLDVDGSVRSVTVVGQLEPVGPRSNDLGGGEPPPTEFARLATATLSGSLFHSTR